jgi:hypothetical protein
LRRKAQDTSRISCKIADGGIELSESYLHAGTLEYVWNPGIANDLSCLGVKLPAGLAGKHG